MLAEMNPGWCRITASVASTRKSMSSCCRSGFTLNTLISVASGAPAWILVMLTSLRPAIIIRVLIHMQGEQVEHRVGYLLKEAQHALRTAMDRALRERDLTTP